MRQERLFIVAAVSLFTALSRSQLTEAQTVLGHPYKSNTRHELTCMRGQQCTWRVRRGGPSNHFEPVELDANIREGTFPVDLNISLNEDTKGTYQCLCRRDEGKMYQVQKEVYFYSADQRFTRPNEVAAMKGEPLKVSACYLSFLPEAANLRTMTLINEATGKRKSEAIRNFCANYTVNVSQPGSYHFQVATREYGNILSETFNVTLQAAVLPTDPQTQKPTIAVPPSDPLTQKPTSAEAEGMIVAITVPIAILFVTLTLLLGAVAFVTCYVLKQSKRNAHNRNLENQAPHEVFVNGNQRNNDGVGNNLVPPLQGNGVSIPLEVRVPDNHKENNGAGDLLPLQGDGVNVPLEVIANGNQLDGDDVGDNPVPLLQGNDANDPPEVLVNVDQLDGDDVSDLPVPALQGNDANVPPEVGVGANQQDNNDVIVNGNQLDDDDGGNQVPSNYVPVPQELPRNGIGDLPSEVDDRHDEHDCGLRVPVAVSNPLHERARWCMNEDMLDRTTEESTLTSEEEESHQNPKQPTPEEKEQLPEQCTDRNKQCRPVDDIQRKASTRSRGAESWPWKQHSFSSQNRATSETDHSLMTRAGYVQTSRDDSLNVPKPFN